jgi:hypothetical protein
MSEPLQPTYSVVLKSIPSITPEFELLEKFAHSIECQAGGVLLQFLCTEVDASHHSYIEMKTFRHGEAKTVTMKLPHHLILMIHGAKENPSLGFLS